MNSYLMGGRVFSSLEAVIDRYKDEQIVEGYRLLILVLKAPFETRWTSKQAEEQRPNRTDIYATIRESRELAKLAKKMRP